MAGDVIWAGIWGLVDWGPKSASMADAFFGLDRSRGARPSRLEAGWDANGAPAHAFPDDEEYADGE
jgi:hypothetical protein